MASHKDSPSRRPSYSDSLKDPRWQKKRLEILERDGWACVSCEGKTETLHVHHGYYEPGRKPWEYVDETLWTLFESCHDRCQFELRMAQRWIGAMHPGLIGSLIGFSSFVGQAYRAAQDSEDDFEIPCHDACMGQGIIGAFWAVIFDIEVGNTIAEFATRDDNSSSITAKEIRELILAARPKDRSLNGNKIDQLMEEV